MISKHSGLYFCDGAIVWRPYMARLEHERGECDVTSALRCRMVSPSSCVPPRWQGPEGSPLLHSFSAITDLEDTEKSKRSPNLYKPKFFLLFFYRNPPCSTMITP